MIKGAEALVSPGRVHPIYLEGKLLPLEAPTAAELNLKDGQVVKTLQGTDLKVTIKDGKVAINGANATAADLAGSNGVIHVIDAVLMPKK